MFSGVVLSMILNAPIAPLIINVNIIARSIDADMLASFTFLKNHQIIKQININICCVAIKNPKFSSNIPINTPDNNGLNIIPTLINNFTTFNIIFII